VGPSPEIQTEEALRDYVYRAAVTYYHILTGTYKRGVDTMAVVDPELCVYGLQGLRIANVSIMPLVTSG
jgi:choline dehydrogenase